MTEQTRTVAPRLAKPWQKFLIGFVGGLCAAIFPRLMASLALYGGGDVSLLSAGYLGIAALFAAMVGAVVMIMEWGVLREPRATFMTALGIPALLAGALNTSNGAYMLDTQAKENSQFIESIQNLTNIQDISTDGFTPLSDAGPASGAISPLSWLGISLAYAGDGGAEDSGLDLNPAMQVQQKDYYVVLYQTQDKEDARRQAKSLQSTVENAQAVRSGNKFLVIDPQPKSHAKAILEAIKLKHEHGLEPKLLKMK